MKTSLAVAVALLALCAAPPAQADHGNFNHFAFGGAEGGEWEVGDPLVPSQRWYCKILAQNEPNTEKVVLCMMYWDDNRVFYAWLTYAWTGSQWELLVSPRRVQAPAGTSAEMTEAFGDSAGRAVNTDKGQLGPGPTVPATAPSRAISSRMLGTSPSLAGASPSRTLSPDTGDRHAPILVTSSAVIRLPSKFSTDSMAGYGTSELWVQGTFTLTIPPLTRDRRIVVDYGDGPRSPYDDFHLEGQENPGDPFLVAAGYYYPNAYDPALDTAGQGPVRRVVRVAAYDLLPDGSLGDGIYFAHFVYDAQPPPAQPPPDDGCGGVCG